MRISLIGMAGTGKSHWSKRLAEQGFRRICCDDLIEAKLSPELRRSDGTFMDMGEWMGFPFMPQYREREARYLALEREVIEGIVEFLEGPQCDPRQDMVIDTSGSVVYTGDRPMKRLGQRTTIVYLSTPPEAQEQLMETYLSNPHPMLWRGLFQKQADETDREALARSYPRLFASRRGLYEKYARVTVDFHTRRRGDFGVPDFLELISVG